MNTVSINLVTWNGAKYIINCLDSVFNQTYTDFSLMIIDNGSTDETLSYITDKYPQLKIVKHKENLGFAKAHNQAIHWSRSKYVLLLNQDMILEPDYLKNLVSFMEKMPEVGAVTGKLRKLHEGEKTNYIDSVGINIYKKHKVEELGAGEQDEGQYDAITEVFGVSGALPLIRRQALESVMENNQFFDEDFFNYKEDVDLSYRLRYLGWKIYKVPTALAYHERSLAASDSSTFHKIKINRKKRSSFSNYLSYRNHLYFLIKNLPERTLNYLFPVIAYEISKFIYILFFES